MSGLRVAYVVGLSSGGMGAHVAMLGAGCAAAGVEVTVYGPAATGARFFPGAGPRQPGIAGPGPAPACPFVPVEIAGRPRPGHDAAAVLRLRRFLARSRPDLVHAHGLRAGALAALAMLALRRRPALLVTVHNMPPGGGLAGAVYRLLERVAARRADAVSWVSGDLAARMQRLGARDGGRALVPAPAFPPPSAAEVAAARRSLGGAGRPVVLAAGRLAPQKGFPVLLAAAARWQDRVPRPLTVIAGDGPLAGELRARAGSAGLDIVFPGQRGDVPALLAAADVVAVPSQWEGQPLIVQEALRAGRPIVASRAGGIPELTGEDGALLVPPGDAAALAAAALAVLADPALAARLAAAARLRAASLPTPADAVAAALAAYRDLAGRRSGARPLSRARG